MILDDFRFFLHRINSEQIALVLKDEDNLDSKAADLACDAEYAGEQLIYPACSQ